MVPSVPSVLRRFTTDWAAPLQPDAINTACAAVGYTAWRDRLLPPGLTVQWFLLPLLPGHTACRHLPHLSGCSCSPSASCQARAKLPRRRLAYLLERLGQATAPTVSAAGRGPGPRTFCVDGAGCSRPETPVLQEAGGPPPEHRPGCGVPVARLCALCHAGTGRCIPLVRAPLLTHALARGQKVPPPCAPGDVLVADRGRCASAHSARLVPQGMPAVCRVGARQIVACTPHRPLVMPAPRRSTARKGLPRSRWRRAVSTDDPRVAWCTPRPGPPWRSPEALEALPPSLVGRELRSQGQQRGCRSRQLPWVTTVRHAACSPCADVAALSRKRWEAATPLGPLTTTRQRDGLPCQTGRGVQQALLVCTMRSHLVRLVILHAATPQQVDVERRRVLDALRWLGAPGTGVPLAALFVHPARPHRVEPRVTKRRPTALPFLTKPRRVFRHALIQQALGD
jgi:hypothetical protein